MVKLSAGGGLAGAGSGAAVGSIFGPVGTGIGAGLGALAGLFTGGSSKKGKIKQAPTQSKLQQELSELINQGLISGEGPFKDLFGGFDEGAFQKGVSEPALKDFQENILPIIQEKFISGNQARGSGIQRASFKAGTDLQSKLAQLMYQAQEQQKQNKLAGLQTALGVKPFENVYRPGTKSGGQSVLEGLSGGLGMGFGNSFANLFDSSNPNKGVAGPSMAANAAKAASIAG